MSDLNQVLSEAQKAREEAEEAARRATELEVRAEEVREIANREREQRRRAWAQRIVDSYDADLTEAEQAIHAAQERFARTAVEDLPGAVEAYLAWGEAAVRHYSLQVRLGYAADMLQMEASAPEFALPPSFSEALDDALGARLAGLSAQAREAGAVEIERMLDEDSLSGAPGATSKP